MNYRLAALIGMLVATGIGFAAPASAGCETQPFAQYCDGPIREDGTWDRCFASAPQATYGQFGQVTGTVPTTSRCTPSTQMHSRRFRSGSRCTTSTRLEMRRCGARDHTATQSDEGSVMMNPVKLGTQAIGAAGELLVQYQLLRQGIDSARLTTDSGIDLVMYVPGHRSAATIQVKTNLGPKPAGGKGKLLLSWPFPDDLRAQWLACVDMSTDSAWLFPTERARASLHSRSTLAVNGCCTSTPTCRSDRNH